MKHAYINGMILDGSKEMEPQQGKVILTDGEKIEAIVEKVQIKDKDLTEYEITDLAGNYIMPGLINLHLHLPATGKPKKKQQDPVKLVKLLTSNALFRKVAMQVCAASAKTQLLSGVTTIRTVGGVLDFDSKIRDQIKAGKLIGPRILSCDMAVSVEGGHMAHSLAYVAHSAEEAAAYVRKIAADHEAVYQYFEGGALQFSIPEILMNALGGEGSFGGFLGQYLGMFLLIIFAGLLTAGIAFLIGIPVLRLKSDYLAIATLGFAEILRAFFQWNTLGPVTNGSNILRKFATYETALFPVIFAGLCVALIVLLINSTYGRAFQAIRDDEIAAEAMGVNLFKHKELAFVISSFFAGVGGALLAMFQNNVASAAFTTNMTYEILLIVVIGGIGSLSGSIMGSFIFIGLNEWLLRGLDQGEWLGIQSTLMRAGFRKVVFAVLIMLVVLFFSKGIMGNRELSWDGIARFFRTLPQRLKAWPAEHKLKRAEKKAERAAKKAAHAAATHKKAQGEAAAKAGKPLFTPLPVYDHVVVFEKEGK